MNRLTRLTRSPIKRSLRSTTAAGAAAALLTLAACQTTPPVNNELTAARNAVQQAQNAPGAARSAELELQRAQQALSRAESAWREGEAEETSHWIYLARQRAAVAVATAEQAQNEDRLRSASADRERVRLEARTREAEAGRRQAGAAQQQAATAQQQAANAQQQTAEARQRAAAAEAAAAAARQQSEQLRTAAAQNADRTAALERDLQAVQARKTERGMVVSLGDVLFDTGRAQLKPGAMRNVDRLATVLQQYPERRVMVEGYTDDTGSDELNLELSRQRADAFAQALRSRGVDAQRIEVMGHGEAYPLASNATPAGRQLNRRVEVLFSDPQGGFAAR